MSQLRVAAASSEVEEHATDFSCFGFSPARELRFDLGTRSRKEELKEEKTGERGKKNSSWMFGKSWERRGKRKGDILIH